MVSESAPRSRDTATGETIVAKYSAIAALLDERTRRLRAATESRAIGFGGDPLVSAATGLARATIHKGRLELEEGVASEGQFGDPVPGVRRCNRRSLGSGSRTRWRSWWTR